jgi:hypothetical protein
LKELKEGRFQVPRRIKGRSSDEGPQEDEFSRKETPYLVFAGVLRGRTDGRNSLLVPSLDLTEEQGSYNEFFERF